MQNDFDNTTMNFLRHLLRHRSFVVVLKVDSIMFSSLDPYKM